MELAGFFSGLKVVELASVLAGPAVGLFFAELGAEVIKIENASTGGDVTRRWKLPSEDPAAEISAYYCSVNYGKESRMLDLKNERNQATVHQLIREADVVISNFKPSSAAKIGMDADQLCQLNPRLIYAHLSAFGPDDALPAFDIVLQAEAGFLYMTGEPGRPPVRMPVALIDLLAAHQLKEGILLALLHRERTGQGSRVTTSLLEAALASLANQASNWLMEGHIPQPMGSQHPNIAPYGDAFMSSDGKPLIIAVGTERQFVGLCEAMNIPDLLQHPDFNTNALRVRHRQALNELLRPAFARYPRNECMSRLQAAGVPAGRVRNMQEVFERPLAQAMVLEDQLLDGRTGRRVRSVAFQLRRVNPLG